MRTRSLVIWMAMTILICALFSATQVTAGRETADFRGRDRALDFSKPVPGNLNYQGHLSDSADSTAVTDTLEMTFRLFDAESGGSELWSETHVQVPVNNGVFSVLLGETTPFPMGLFDGSTMWLQTEVGAEVLSPRKPLVSVAYGMRSQEADHAANADYAVDADHAVDADNATDALHAAEADHAVHADTALFSQPDADWTIDGNDMYSGVSGNVGIGTTNPGQVLNTKFDVFGRVSIRNEAGEYALIADYSDTPPAFQRLYSDKTGGGTARDFILGVYPSGHLNQLVLKNDGNVGIGTASPAEKLDVAGAVQMTAFKLPGGAAAGHVLTCDAGGTGSWQAPAALPDGDWTIVGNDMLSAVSGNVGIGMVGPSSRFSVLDNATGEYGLRVDKVTTGGNSQAVSAVNSAVPADGYASHGGFFLANANATGTGTKYGIRGHATGSGGSNYGGYFFANGATNNYGIYVDGGDVYLGPDNVGIGISNPAAKLDVNGVIQATGGSSTNWNTAYGWGDHAAVGYFELGATNNSATSTYWNSTAAINVLNLDSDTPLAAVYIDNNYAGNTWGLSAGLQSSSAGASSYGVYGFNYGSGYAVFGRNYHASGIGVRGINNSSSNFGDLGAPGYGAYGEHNSGNYGYLGSSSSGVYGSHVDGNYSYIATNSNCFYGNLVTTDPGDYALYGYGTDASGEDGTGYGYATTLGAVKGYNYFGNPYTFAVGGFSYLDFNRSGGCFGGRHNGAVWGCFGYQNSAGTEYGGYATSWAPGPKGQLSTGIGFGSWGELFGADIHGKIYGTYTEGGNYALYSNGDVFTNGMNVHLQETATPSMAVLYTNVSTDMTVQTSGFATLAGGKSSITFDQNFTKAVSPEVPVVVTVTPTGPCEGVYVSGVTKDGFTVVENGAGKSDITVAFIAIGRRAGYENPQLPAEVISSDYVDKLSRGLHNDADTDTDGEGLYYENGQLLVGAHPSTLPDPHKPPEQLDAPEELKSRPPEIITDTQDGAANGQASSGRAPRSTEAR